MWRVRKNVRSVRRIDDERHSFTQQELLEKATIFVDTVAP